MVCLNSTLNFGLPPVLVFQQEVYYEVDRLLTGLTAQSKGTTTRWYSNKTSLFHYQWRSQGLESIGKSQTKKIKHQPSPKFRQTIFSAPKMLMPNFPTSLNWRKNFKKLFEDDTNRHILQLKTYKTHHWLKHYMSTLIFAFQFLFFLPWANRGAWIWFLQSWWKNVQNVTFMSCHKSLGLS